MADEKTQNQALNKNEIKIEIDDQTSNGVYSNFALISHTDNEFVLDFIFVQPQYGKAKVRTRVITTPAHAKKILLALQDNIAKYEQQFGPIKEHTINVKEAKPKFYN
ncbi:MAG: DUF3467 domain-containing protein [Elusimicrobiota bacterium]|jgi:hypothetical protein|nr:DUF3467 domain-containing protein [Elusimicrobiota bacterium]